MLNNESLTLQKIKDHPLIIPFLIFAGTLAFFETVILPIQVAEYKGDQLKLKEYENNISEYDKKINNLTKQLNLAESRLYSISLNNVFEKNNPYPIGLGDIKLNDEIEKIYTTYRDIDVAKDLRGDIRHISVETKHPYFNAIFYVKHNKKTNKDLISSITFRVKDNFKSNLFSDRSINGEIKNMIKNTGSIEMSTFDEQNMFLFSNMNVAFGKPSKHEWAGYYSWEAGGVNIFCSPLGRYMIYEKPDMPASFPKKL